MKISINLITNTFGKINLKYIIQLDNVKTIVLLFYYHAQCLDRND